MEPSGPSLPIFTGAGKWSCTLEQSTSPKSTREAGQLGSGFHLLKELLIVLKDVWEKAAWQNHNRTEQGGKKVWDKSLHLRRNS